LSPYLFYPAFNEGRVGNEPAHVHGWFHVDWDYAGFGAGPHPIIDLITIFEVGGADARDAFVLRTSTWGLWLAVGAGIGAAIGAATLRLELRSASGSWSEVPDHAACDRHLNVTS
jgi:hypothetical protein